MRISHKSALSSMLLPVTVWFRSHPTAHGYSYRIAWLLIGACTSFILWNMPTKGIQDVLVWGAFLYALVRWRLLREAWRPAPGSIAIAAFAYALLQLPFSVNPGLATQHILKHADFAAAALAIPLILHTRERIWMALLATAAAFSVVIACDFARLIAICGWAVRAQARFTDPFPFGHPNSAAMAAGLALIVCAAGAIRYRKNPVALLSCLMAVVILAAYEVVVSSRGPQMALIAAAATALFLVGTGRRARVLAILGITIVAVATVALNPRFAERASHGWLTDRDKVWKHTCDLVQERPILGHGYGHEIFMEAYHTADAPASTHTFYHPHNYWLHTVFAGGWIGALLHIAVWATTGLVLVRISRRPGPWDARILPAALAALIVFFQAFGLIDNPAGVITVMMAWTVPMTVALAGCREDSA